MNDSTNKNINSVWSLMKFRAIAIIILLLILSLLALALIHFRFLAGIGPDSFSSIEQIPGTALNIIVYIWTSFVFLLYTFFILLFLAIWSRYFLRRIVNKQIKLFFIKIFFSKSIANDFINQNSKELSKIKKFEKFSRKQLINSMAETIVISYESAISPIDLNIQMGVFKKPGLYYLDGKNMDDFKFNFIASFDTLFQFCGDEEKTVIKHFAIFCAKKLF